MINFLPETFARQNRRRRRKYRHVVLLSMFALCLAAWGFAERGRNILPKNQAQALEQQVREAREQMNEFMRLRAERDALLQQQRVKDELSQPISHTQVILALDRHLPDSIGLTNLEVLTERPEPRKADTKSSKKSDAKRRDAAPPVNELEIEMDGIAPDDLTIANLIGELSEDDLFDRVTLKFSRTTEAQGVEGRMFKMMMRVRLDRRFETEVAHAD